MPTGDDFTPTPRLLALLGCALALPACGAANRAQSLEDGSWRVQCEDDIERCLREAERACDSEGYSIEGGKKETKLYGGDTGYQTGADLHTLRFRCGPTPAPAASADEPPRNSGSSPTEDSGTEPARQRACVPGSTQSCVGPGGCPGGQSCNAKGSAFLPCDCGAVESSRASEPPHEDTDAPGPLKPAGAEE